MRGTTTAAMLVTLLALSCSNSSTEGDGGPEAGTDGGSDAGAETDGGGGTDAGADAGGRDGGSGVGAACLPGEVPAGGFNAEEVYLETSSTQCATRVCMVYELAGDPSEGCTEDCADPEEVDARVFCSCRCSAPDGQPTCECPEGFACEPVLDSSAVGEGVRGSYCVRETLVEP